MKSLKDKINLYEEVMELTKADKKLLEDVKQAVNEFQKLLNQKHTSCEKCNELSRCYDTFVLCDNCANNNNYEIPKETLREKFKEVFGEWKE